MLICIWNTVDVGIYIQQETDFYFEEKEDDLNERQVDIQPLKE